MHVYVGRESFTTKPRFEIVNLHSFKLINFQGSRLKKNTQVQVKDFVHKRGLVVKFALVT